MSKIKLFIFFMFLVNFNNHSLGDIIEIKVIVQNEIITNIDIDNEKNYLFFLNPKLKEIDDTTADDLAKNSLITEIIKKKELENFFDLNKKNDFLDVVENNLLRSKNIRNRDELVAILNSKNINYQVVKNKLKIETFWNQLIYNKYAKNVIIDKESLKKRILNQFNKKEVKFAYNLSEIIFSESIDESIEEKFLKLNKSIEEIGFENTANIYSISNTSKNGGLIGWINDLQISSQIKENIKNLKINQVSKPIKFQNGYILLRVNDKKEFKQEIDLDEELKKLINKERNRQLNSFSTVFFKRLKKNIEINEF